MSSDPPDRGADRHPAAQVHQTRSLVGSVGWMGAASALALAAGIVRQKVFAVFLGPAGLGALSLAVAVWEFGSSALRMGAPTGLLREVSAVGDGVPDGQGIAAYKTVRTAVLGLSTVLLLGTAVWTLAGPSSQPWGGALPPWTLLVLAAALPLALVAQLRETLLTAAGRIRLLATQKMAVTLGTLAATLLLVATLGLAGAVLQITAGAFIAFVAAGWAVRRLELPTPRLAERDARGVLRRVYGVGGAEAVYHLAIVLNLLLFRTFVVASLGLGEAGLYQSVLGLSRQWVPAVLGGVFVTLYPRLARARDGGGAGVEEALRFLFVLGVPVALGLLATRDLLIRLVFTEAFLAAQGLFRWTAPGDVLALMAGVFPMALLARGKARALIVTGLVAEAGYLACFVLALGRFGLDGAAAAYALASAAGLLLFAWGFGRSPLDLLRAIGPVRALVGAALLTGGAFPPEPTLALRIVLLVAAGVWAFAHRESLGWLRSPPTHD